MKTSAARRGSCATSRFGHGRAWRTVSLPVLLDKGRGRTRQVLCPVIRSGVVGSVRHVLDTTERRTGASASLGERITFHVDDITSHGRPARLETITGAAHTVWQVGEQRLEFELRRFGFERRHARREAQTRDVHVALHELRDRRRRSASAERGCPRYRS